MTPSQQLLQFGLRGLLMIAAPFCAYFVFKFGRYGYLAGTRLFNAQRNKPNQSQ